MKNIFLSLMVFVVMSLLNAQFTDWSLVFTDGKSGGIAMAPIAVLVSGLMVSAIGFLTVLIFNKTYNTILKNAFLFEIIYLFTLIIRGANPFAYFTGGEEILFLDFLLYLNSFFVLLMMFLIDRLYSKINLEKSKNNIDQ